MTDPIGDARAAARKVFERRYPDWVQVAAGSVPDGFPVTVLLPGTTAADAAADRDCAETVLRAWQTYSGPGTVENTNREWRHARIPAPTRIRFSTADDIALFTGEDRRYRMLAGRFHTLQSQWPNLSLVGRATVNSIGAQTDDDWVNLLRMLAWADNHDPAGFYPRQLPVPGMDTKWVQARWPLVQTLSNAGGRTSTAELGTLRKAPDLFFARILDPEIRSQLGGLGWFNAPVNELARLNIQPHTVIICENFTNGHAFTNDRAGTVVIAGKGMAVAGFANLPWVADAEHVLYWGDIDTNGFAILNRFRMKLPAAQSILMDETTLHAGKRTWVDEATPSRATLTELTDIEQSIYRNLVTGKWSTDTITNVRFEQERVPWAVVEVAVVAAELQPSSKSDGTD
jgi:hypothetical protein